MRLIRVGARLPQNSLGVFLSLQRTIEESCVHELDLHCTECLLSEWFILMVHLHWHKNRKQRPDDPLALSAVFFANEFGVGVCDIDKK